MVGFSHIKMITMFRGQEEASTASIFCTSWMHDDKSACLVGALVHMWIVGLCMIPRRLSVICLMFEPSVASTKAVSELHTGWRNADTLL